MIKYKTFFNEYEGTPETIKEAFKIWAKGALNVPTNEKVKHYFKRFIISGITYKDFKNLVKYDKEKQKAIYQSKKSSARELIIDCVNDMREKALSWWDCVEMQEKLYNIAKRYGLIKELKENGLL